MNERYRITRHFHYGIVYRVEFKVKFWIFSWWSYLTDGGAFNSPAEFSSPWAAQATAEELLKGDLVRVEK